MGNNHCEQCREIKNENSAYGEFQVCQQQGRQLAIIEKKLHNKQGLSGRVFNELDRRTKIKTKHVVRLYRFEVVDCGHEVRVALYYEYMPRTLREYLQQLQLRGEIMGEKQIFGLIYGVQAGLQALYDLGAAHNCLNLDTILCRGGFFKVTDVSATTNLSSYDLVLQGDREQFLSERMLNNLSCTMIRPVGSSMDDDLFSLALIVLMIVGGGSPGQFYVWHHSEKVLAGSLNYRQIEGCMRLLTRNYSSKLVSKVRALLALGQAHGPEEEEGECGTLTAELQDLQEDMSRVLNRIKHGSEQKTSITKQTTMKNSYYQTPFRLTKE